MVNIGWLPSLETGALVFMLKRAFSVQFFIFIFVFLHFSDSFPLSFGYSFLVLKNSVFRVDLYTIAFKNTPNPISNLA